MAESVIQMSAEPLATLRPLRDNVTGETIPCKICSGGTAAFDVVDFNKSCDQRLYPFGFCYIPVIYYRCEACSFIFTTFCDSWTSADFSKFIYNDDYALVDPEYTGSRATRTASTIAEILRGCENARILDYGSGSGVFAEAMKTHGFSDIEGYDPFSAPERPTGLFEILTCFEVVEHAVSPLAVFEDMLSLLASDGAIIIGVGLQPANIGEIRCNWWYIAPRNGHVSIYAQETFTRIAEKLGLTLRMGNGLYAFSRPTVSSVIQVALDHIGLRLGAPADDDFTQSEIRLIPGIFRKYTNWHKFRKPPCWNGREIAGSTPFRWTNSSEVLWPTRRFWPGTKIQIPYLMEIVPGFAQGSRVFLGARPLLTEVSHGCITATVTLAQAVAETVRLVTPPPRTPKEWGTPDPRTLGLAIPIA
jgi:2-polyprenyl-3-methyl-5-hydroxy-6-metoxy-1,4-benzoquinol methylase